MDNNNRKNQIEKAIAIGTLITGASVGLYYFFKSAQKSEAHQYPDKSSNAKKRRKCSSDICPICFEMMINACRTFDCQHIFHKKCIDEWQKVSKTCPVCRSHIENF